MTHVDPKPDPMTILTLSAGPALDTETTRSTVLRRLAALRASQGHQRRSGDLSVYRDCKGFGRNILDGRR